MYRTVLTAPVFGLRREIDRLFEDTFGRDSGGAWSPAVDIHEDPQALSFEVELPGLAPEHVEVTADQGVLTIRGEKRSVSERGDENARVHLIERTYGSFSRSFQLPANVDEERIEAQFENGVLSVRVPKAALPQPKKISIRNTRNVSTVGSGGTGGTQRIAEGAKEASREPARAGNGESPGRSEGTMKSGMDAGRKPAMAKAER